MEKPYTSALLPRNGRYFSTDFDNGAYKDIPVHIRHIHIHLKSSGWPYIAVYSTGSHTLYFDGTGRDRRWLSEGERDTLKKVWDEIRKKPDFSYQVKDENSNLNQVLKNIAKAIDDYTDYIEDYQQEKNARYRNARNCETIDIIRHALAPEKTLYPTFRHELQETVTDIQDSLRFFFQREKPPEQYYEHMALHGRPYDSFNVLYFLNRYQNETKKDLQDCLEKLHKEHGEAPSPAAGQIVPGAKTVPEAMHFLNDLEQGIMRIHDVLMENHKDDAHRDMMQVDIMMVLNHLAKQYPDIQLIQEPVQAFQKMDHDYQKNHPLYAELAKQNEAKTTPYAIRTDFPADKIPKVLIECKDGTKIKGNLMEVYYACKYGIHAGQKDNHIVLFTIDNQQHHPTVLNMGDLLDDAEGKGEIPVQVHTSIQNCLDDIVSAVTKNGGVFLEERPHLGEARPTFRLFSSCEAFIMDQYRIDTALSSNPSIEKNPYHVVASEAAQASDCTALYVDGDKKHLGDHHAVDIHSAIGVHVLPDMQKDISEQNDDAIKNALFHEQNILVHRPYVYGLSNDSEKYTPLHAYVTALNDYVHWYIEHENVLIDSDTPASLEKDIDPHIARVAFSHAKKDWPYASQEQCKQFVAKVIQSASPNAFLKGPNYGHYIADKVQKELSVQKNKDIQH